MIKKFLPQQIENSLKDDFSFPQNLLFCQVATCSDVQPHLRSMRLYGIDEAHGLIFLTHNTSRKWLDLKKNPHLALCFLHPNCSVQLQAEGKVSLYTYAEQPKLVQKYWEMVKPEVKKIYRDDYEPDIEFEKEVELDVPTSVPTRVGLITVVPHFWEYLGVVDDYPKSLRYQFKRDIFSGWSQQRLTT